MDKGALHAKLAHIEAETDKVTQSRVALTERESERQSVPVIKVFTSSLSSWFRWEQFVYFLPSLPS